MQQIETERLRLRPFTYDDVDALHALWSRPDVTAHLPTEPMSRDEVERFVAWVVETRAAVPEVPVPLGLVVVDKADDRVVGWCGLGRLAPRPEETEVFYGLHPERWGRGLAVEAARAVLEHAFGTLGLRRVVAVTRPENVASVRVLERLGMAPAGALTGVGDEHAFYEGELLFVMER